MFKLTTHTSPTDLVLNEIHFIQSRVFGEPYSLDHLRARLEGKSILSIHVVDGDRVVAFKTGYATDAETFYSWIGGVDPDYRRRGLASQLLEAQHTWLQAAGYNRVRTKTQNAFKAMLILNLESGFDIIETFVEEGRGLQILLEKNLRLK